MYAFVFYLPHERIMQKNPVVYCSEGSPSAPFRYLKYMVLEPIRRCYIAFLHNDWRLRSGFQICFFFPILRTAAGGLPCCSQYTGTNFPRLRRLDIVHRVRVLEEQKLLHRPKWLTYAERAPPLELGSLLFRTRRVQ